MSTSSKLGKALELIKENSFDKAENLLLELLNDLDVEEFILAKVYEQLGILYLQLERYEESIGMWQKLEQTKLAYLYNPHMIINKVECLYYLGDIKNAILGLKDHIITKDVSEDLLKKFVFLIRQKYEQSEIHLSLNNIPSTFFWVENRANNLQSQILFVKFLDFDMRVDISVYFSLPTNKMKENLDEKIHQFLGDSKFYEKFGFIVE